MADLFLAGRDWSTVNLDHAADERVIHEVSATLVTNGIRHEPITPPLMTTGAISPLEACSAAALLAGHQPGDVARLSRDSEGHLPQDIISIVAKAVHEVSSGADGIPGASPRILFGQGNVRTLRDQQNECHAIVVAFSVERA